MVRVYVACGREAERCGPRRCGRVFSLDASARAWNMLSMRAILLLCAMLVVGIAIGRATAKIGSTEGV
jgi:hypothetical protein